METYPANNRIKIGGIYEARRYAAGSCTCYTESFVWLRSLSYRCQFVSLLCTTRRLVCWEWVSSDLILTAIHLDLCLSCPVWKWFIGLLLGRGGPVLFSWRGIRYFWWRMPQRIQQLGATCLHGCGRCLLDYVRRVFLDFWAQAPSYFLISRSLFL